MKGIYTVTSDETLWTEAKRLKINVYAWLRYNDLKLTNSGIILRLPDLKEEVKLKPENTLLIPPKNYLFNSNHTKEEGYQTNYSKMRN